MNKTARKLVDELQAVLDRHGVETAVVVMRDPDRLQALTHTRGDTLWMVGALEAQKQEIVLGWVKPKTEDDD